MTARLLIISGPPGAGKSTVAQGIADSFERSVLVQGDTFFAFLASGAIDPWLPASAAQNEVVTEAASAATRQFVEAGYDTIYEGVLGPWSIDRFLAASGLATADYAILLPSVERCLHRVATRAGHGFSDEAATRKMHHEFTTATVAGRHVFANDDEGPSVTVGRIRSAVDAGELRYVGPL